MSEELRIAQQRIKRFERLGGVNLKGLDPEVRPGFLAEVHMGLANYKKTIFRFQCPMCGKFEELDQEMSPGCTGPNWTDDHALEPMVLVGELFV